MIDRGLARSKLGKPRRRQQIAMQSMAAAETTRTLVNVAASTSLGPRAKRHSIELAEKQSIAAVVSVNIFSRVSVVWAGADIRGMIDRHVVAASATLRRW